MEKRAISMNVLKLPGDKRTHVSEHQRRHALDAALGRATEDRAATTKPSKRDSEAAESGVGRRTSNSGRRFPFWKPRSAQYAVAETRSSSEPADEQIETAAESSAGRMCRIRGLG